MIKITCFHRECATKDFCIAPPNTKTSIAYTDNLDLSYNIQAAVKTPGANFRSGFTGGAKKSEGLSTPIYLGLATIEEMETDDYLVVYCDSGHKNYVPFNYHKKE